MPLSLSQLLIGVLRACTLRWKETLITLLVLTTLLTAAQAVRLWGQARYQIAVFGEDAISRDLSLAAHLRQGPQTPVAIQQLREAQERLASRMDIIAGKSATPFYVQTMGPFLVVSLLFTLCAVMLAGMMGLLIAGSEMSLFDAARLALVRLAGMIGLSAVLFACSLLWIPLVAIIRARFQVPLLAPGMADVQTVLVVAAYLVSIFLLPRLSLAPAFLLLRDRGPLQSLQAALMVSRGHWGKIIGNLLAVSVLCLMSSLLIDSLLASGVGWSPWMHLLPVSLLVQGSVLCLGMVLARLTSTLEDHPVVSWDDEELPQVAHDVPASPAVIVHPIAIPSLAPRVA